MATFDGFLRPAADWDYAEPGATGWAFSSSDNTHAPKASQAAGPLTNNLPIAEASATKTGKLLSGWTGDYLDRIHVNPAAVNFGSVVGPTVRTVEIWNAYQTTKQLAAFTALNTDSIAISPTPTPPQLFAALQAITYTLTADENGPPVINGSYSFAFAGVATVFVTLLGKRLTAWTWRPNWDNEIIERLGWLTDVLISYNGREQRRRLRRYPRRDVEFDALLVGVDRRTLEAAVAGWQARVWALPLWWDGQLLAATLPAGSTSVPIDTTSREFKPNSVALLTTGAQAFEVIQVASVSAGSLTLSAPTTIEWPAGAACYPTIAARMGTQQGTARFTEDSLYFRAQFQASEPADAVTASYGSAPVYLGYPVVDLGPILPGDIRAGTEVKVFAMDNQTAFEFVDDEAGQAFFAQQHGWLMKTHADKAAVRALLYYLQGRYAAAWFPTWAYDFKLVADATSGATNIDVEWVGYTQYQLNKPGRGHIRIERQDGTASHHKITGSSEVSSSIERLGLTPAIAPALTTADVRRISYLQLMRGTGDSNEIAHWTGDVGQTLISLRSFKHDL